MKKRGSQTRQDFHTCSRSLTGCFNYNPFIGFTRQWFKRREVPKKVNKITFPTHFIRLKMHGVLPLSQGSRFYTAIQYFNVSLPSCSVYNILICISTHILSKDVQNLSTLEGITSSIHLEKCLHSENKGNLQVEKIKAWQQITHTVSKLCFLVSSSYYTWCNTSWSIYNPNNKFIVLCQLWSN